MTTNDPFNVALGQAIRTYRERAAMTPEEVAESAGIPLGEYLQIEQGEIEAAWGDLRRIAERAIKIPLPEILAQMEKRLDREQIEDAGDSPSPSDAN